MFYDGFNIPTRILSIRLYLDLLLFPIVVPVAPIRFDFPDFVVFGPFSRFWCVPGVALVRFSLTYIRFFLILIPWPPLARLFALHFFSRRFPSC